MKKIDQTVLLFQKAIFSSDRKALLELVQFSAYKTKKPLILFTPNPEQLVLAHHHPVFDRLLEQADILIPDGIGLVWASWLLSAAGKSQPISQRISGIDVVIDLLRLASREGWRALLLGGRDYHQAGARVINLPTDLQKTLKTQLHWLEGYLNAARPTKAEEQQVAAAFAKLKPQLVFVALGAPQQERWVIEHRNLLQKSGTKVIMVVGGSFDILLGKLKRAPLWMRALGLEWFYRLLQEPWRTRRQSALPKFIGLTLRELLRKKN